MHIFITRVSFIFLSFYASHVYAAPRDEVLTEVQFREAPKALEQSLAKTLPALPHFTSAQEFTLFAQQKRISSEELKRDIQLSARLKMALYNKDKNRYIVAKQLSELLEHISSSAFDKSYLLMLKGRYAGRSQQDYASAIEYYQQAVQLVEHSNNQADRVLLYTLQEHLSVMHMILREEVIALQHLKKLSTISKQLNNDYFIAHAESILGKYFYKQDQLGKSLSHYTEAVKYTRGGENASQNAHIELQLARIYRDLESWEEALTSAHNAAEAFSLLGNENYVSSSMTVIAMIYANQGQWYKAIDYHLNAQQIESKLGNYIGLALNLHNLGEAYYKIGDIQSSLINLERANEIFTSKKSNHYLVYNDLIIAEVTASTGDWQKSLDYATKAAEIAQSKQLNEELEEALTRQTDAFEKLGRYEDAYNSLLILNKLNTKAEAPATEFDMQQSQIIEQKLKLNLNQLQNALQAKTEQFNMLRLVSILCILTLFFILLLLIKQWRLKSKFSAVNSNLTQAQLLEPFTGLPGYLAFKLDYANQYNKPIKTLALISLSDQLSYDLVQGYQCNADMNKQQLLAIKNALNCEPYIIRPGLFLMSLDSSIEPNSLLTTLRSVINENDGETSLQMGILHLPLLGDLAIKLTAGQHFASLQMMLSAARTLGSDKDYFVTMKALNFASAGIFSKPLYLNIEKSIVRGIIKIETNGNKEDIIWPRWKSHQNIDINDDKIAV
ncbi:Tetratricopeptide domain protein [Shewanella halifaxensis HAW-EB4]|uniref:Tetratricopeptide domain protein n=1 Tax=Shewanella halifaxensis (strain HAW-EB4) TaxID=458817 RepID=B0TPG4_SHEHH|nr:tetratricopeptide repeat protein [Shewanella halifaxensis]ABZ77611.1 Tetratricopeptide domain protein [Shewanella halifaxensis HAW-EB4]